MIFFSLFANAEVRIQDSDSISITDTIPHTTKFGKFTTGRWVQSTYIGVPLIAGSITEMKHNKRYRSSREGTLEKHSNGIDSYLEYAPAVATLALKAIGVESRSSWKKMIAADVLSAALVVSTSEGIKRAGKIQRPDGRDNHSYPSGHTAIAFMGATMLNKEYGHISPWIGYSAYSAALSVGLMRVMKNRHWSSDVLAGAGIGIMGTEFGYWLSDLCFPKESNGKGYSMKEDLEDCDRPHFINSFFGYYIPISSKNIGNGMRLKTSNGGVAGVEGAYFLSRHFGIGAEISFSNIDYIVEGDPQLEDDSSFFSTLAGGYFSCPIYQRLCLGARLMGGISVYPDINRNIKASGDGSGFTCLAGISIGMQARQHLDFKLGVDYEYLASPGAGLNDVQTFVISGGASIHF